MQGKIGDKIRLKHILNAILELDSYLMDASFDNFMDDSMMRFASIKQIEIIGEASNQISEETKNKFTEIEWRQIVGLRNVLVHEYFGVDVRLIWEIIKTDIPLLKTKVTEILSMMK